MNRKVQTRIEHAQPGIGTAAEMRRAVPMLANPEPNSPTSRFSGRKVQELANLTPTPPLHRMERGQGERTSARPALTPVPPFPSHGEGARGKGCKRAVPQESSRK